MTGGIEPGDAGQDRHGRVFWFTGLSGSGKTTIGGHFFEKLRARQSKSIFLDGNVLREVFGDDLGYSLEERRKCAWRYCRLTALLAGQGLHVVIATISMFEECRRWNRRHIPRYFEVYLRASLSELAARDNRGLYRAQGGGSPVVGLDVPFEEPQQADLIIDNDWTLAPVQVAQAIWERVSELSWD